jgi:hypothetical protein
MAATAFAPDRTYHWLRPNHATRSPHRWIVMDSESHRTRDAFGETQTFRLAVARRWHDERGTVQAMATDVFDAPDQMWQWVGDFVRPGKSTVLWCHNLDFDLQNTDAFRILPAQGWKMTWCNLDEQVSMVKWVRDGATLRMADTNSFFAKPLAVIGAMLGIGKPDLPAEDDSREAWVTRCVADVEITTCAVMTLIDYIRDNQLGNMQFSGAGMGYGMWRHKYLNEKVLVHANKQACDAERAAMHTGRAEAWRHGIYDQILLDEWDLTNAYTRIARDNELPRQLIKEDPAPTMGRYRRWAAKWACLAKVVVTTDVPAVPVREDGRFLWPVGTFETWLWDTELEMALGQGAEIRLLHVYAYLRGPIMRDWAQHTLDVLHNDHPEIPSVIKLWYKQQARSTIGRCGLRYTVWEESGPDWIGLTGLSTATRADAGDTFRLLHIGGVVWEETGKQEGRDSMPFIPSWIAARCRVLLWEAMTAAGLQHVYYVDTDSVILDQEGSARMRAYADEHPELGWRIKQTHRRAEIYGPRQIVTEQEPRIAGVAKRAKRTGPRRFEGEVWQRAASGLASGRLGEVRVKDRQWHIQWSDRRRRHLDDGTTEPLRLGDGPSEEAPLAVGGATGRRGVA